MVSFSLVVHFLISWAENRANFWLTKSRRTVQTVSGHFQVRGHKNPIMLMLRYDGKGQEDKLVLCGSAIMLTT